MRRGLRFVSELQAAAQMAAAKTKTPERMRGMEL
jgi:hypothetical protein